MRFVSASSSASSPALILLAACMAIAAPASSQNAPPATPAPQKIAFEVISIRPSSSSAQNMSWRNAPDGLIFTNIPMNILVRSAFSIIADDQVSGLPHWADSDHYDIQARMSDEDVAAFKKLTRDEASKQRHLLVQSLLAERCQFKFHRETRQLPVFDLVIAKGGLKMQAAKPMEGSRTSTGDEKFTGLSVPIESLAYSLSQQVGHVIIDKTGLSDKKFDIDLKWTPDEQQGSADAGPNLFTALEEQLGLKLVASKGPVETVVVDRMEKPTPN